MTRYTGPKLKKMDRFGVLPEGVSKRKRKKGARVSEYGMHLLEKQKLKFIYGIPERQLRRYIREIQKSKEDWGELLLQTIEMRLDNVVYRLGFASTRPQARQMVTHGHVKIFGRKVTVPSFLISPGNELEISEKIKIPEEAKKRMRASVPGWLEQTENGGRVLRSPERDELPKDINVGYVLENYR